ncbi:discoidin domain-containing protein [Paenibacillus xylanexedens]|uniref:discoidin domain-containing protein n=1 Tax=Paenibacillus xylanexedens TaxID=528191 RepID=UPI0011A08ED9|nr:discoidin domain-containing protein [Paenibacillus xylanexedens]
MNKSFIDHDGEYTKWKIGDPAIDPVNLIPKMTSNTSPSGTVTVSSTLSNFQGWLVFDRLVSTGSSSWIANGKTGWLEYDFNLGNEKIIGGYTILQESDIARSPKSWTFEGSNDGTNWTILDTRVNITNWTLNIKKSFSFSNTNFYRKYRINVTENSGDNYLAISEMEWLSAYIPATPSKWDTISTTLPSENTFINEGMDLSVLTRSSKVITQTMINTGNLGSGKVFKSTVNLKKYIEITNLSVK